MELLVLATIVILVGSICGIAALVQISGLRREVAELRDRLLLARWEPSDCETSPSEPTISEPADPLPVTVAAPALTAIEKRPIVPDEVPPAPPTPVAISTPPAPETGRAAKSTKPLDLETLLGAKGSVWIGGIALLLGAVFLLRYTIEAGLLTPLMRVALAVLMGVVALAASEGLARRSPTHPAAKALAARADIPALLAAIGVFSLFGAVYAAHALYGLLGTLPAFIGMAAVALAGMGLSLRRGPWLAGIGLIGALATPLLVASVTPSYIGVFAYVALITAAAIAVARRQGWSWLTGAALAGATGWLWVLLGKAVDPVQFGLWGVGVVTVLWLTARALGRSDSPLESRDEKGNVRLSPPLLWTGAGWIGLLILTGMAMEAGNDLSPLSLGFPFLMMAVTLAALWRHPVARLWPLPLVAAFFFVILFADPVSRLPRDQSGLMLYVQIAVMGLVLLYSLALLNRGDRLAQREDDRASTVLIVGGGLLATWMLVSGLRTMEADGVRIAAPFALSALFLTGAALRRLVVSARAALWAGALVWAAALNNMVTSVPLMDADPLEWAAGLAAMGAMVVFLLSARRSDLWTRIAALILPAVGALIALDALSEPETYISTRVGLNELWLFLGLPGGVAALGGWMMRRTEDFVAQAARAGAGVFGLLLIVFLIHHAMNGGDLTARLGFESVAVQLLVAFAALLGTSFIRGGPVQWPDSAVDRPTDLGPYLIPGLALLVTGASLGVFALCQFLVFNPLLNGATRFDGPPVFNALFIGYLLPALLLGLTALRSVGRRPALFVRVLGGLSGLAWLIWTIAQIRVFAQGPHIEMGAVPWDNGELYAISAVWLLTGLGLLLAGSLLRRRDLRIASAGLILLTTLKVFLVDMSELDGALRALSFIGLGVSLIGIGRFYQRVLSRPDVPLSAENDETRPGIDF